MDRDEIAEIEISDDGKLILKPSLKKFPYIYREAMGVHWNAEESSICSPVPNEWGYYEWIIQIISAAMEQGCELIITPHTKWTNIDDELQERLAEGISLAHQRAKNN